MKKIVEVILLFAIIITVGCAATLPDKGTIQNNYSIADVKTFSSTLNCENTKVTEARPNFAQDYCQVLDSNIKMALKRENPNIQLEENSPDLKIMTTLEQIHGGSAAARFWIGFGAGRSITTIYVSVEKNDKIIAERRFTETTTMPNIATGTYANEDAILQDAPLIARKIAEFIKDPVAYEKKQKKTDNQ
ncbi:MAG: DUF4410 domain-containing protein [Desulfobulbaceae bacterium]|nr:DUF4410 domain-containing protein [Desulfobulbaceae bacterium]